MKIPQGQIGIMQGLNGVIIVDGGVIDPGFDGEVNVTLVAQSATPYAINKDSVFAQLFIHECCPPVLRRIEQDRTVQSRINALNKSLKLQKGATSSKTTTENINIEDRPISGDLVSRGWVQPTQEPSENTSTVVHVDDDVANDTDVMSDTADFELHDGPIPMQIALCTISGRRQYAAALAQTELDRCDTNYCVGQSEGDTIASDSALLQVLRNWTCDKNSHRHNIMPSGNDWIASDLFGATRSRGLRDGGDTTWGITKRTRNFASVAALCNRWLRDRLHGSLLGDDSSSSSLPSAPWFWSSITLNKGFASRRHRDSNNVGPSIIRAFGDADAGGLYYWPDDPGTGAVNDLQPNDKQLLELRLPLHLAAYDGKQAPNSLMARTEYR